ncbi:Flavoprotein [Micromonospora citrea]|uniref:Flavoprotein n=1 Tax=Micromonospora citrea TaxID=47855 RepID=A0A1C6VSH4_9ACTN|nr:flavoprotein [Micromonospora citrea]SCL69064.1 Flavoprotein [Micromonospora citrea]
MTDPRVLHLVVCAAPPALQIGELVELLKQDGWTVCVIATPTAARWLDQAALTEQTGYPVRSEWRLPGEPDVHPRADAVMVAPATFNTINKWALGISDNLALGILNETIGAGLPIVAFPYAKDALASHPAYGTHLQRLRVAGVNIAAGAPWSLQRRGDTYSWRNVADALNQQRPAWRGASQRS